MKILYRSTLSRGRSRTWLRLRYSQSFLSQPARCLLQFCVRSGGTVEYVLPAAGFGRTRWLGPIPPDAFAFTILSPHLDPRRFRLDAVETLGAAGVAARILLRRPASLPGFVLALRSRSARVQALRALAALDIAPLSEFPSFVRDRTRPPELEDFDKDEPADATAIAFVLEADGGSPDALVETLGSFAAQVATRFRLHVLVRDPAAERSVTTAMRTLPEFRDRTRITVSAKPALFHAAASAETWVCQVQPGDRLAPEAVLCLGAHLRDRRDLDAVYTDSALKCVGTLSPILKPDWSPLLLEQHDYIDRLLVFRTQTLHALASARSQSDAGTATWSDLLRDRGGKPLRVDHLRRVLLTITDEASPPPSVAARRVHASPRSPCTAIVIPTRDRSELLETAVESIRMHTRADTTELVVVDNDSCEAATLAYLARMEQDPRIAVVRCPGPFNFSRLINLGVARARSETLVLLNNDCAALHDGWLDTLGRLAARPDVGAVGAKLLYDDGTLQHAGVGIGLGGEAGHRNRKRSADFAGFLDRLRYTHEISAVTGACLAVEREKFAAAGGFDEAFAVAFNDIDFCLRLRARGLRNLYTPDAVLRHSESLSRGSDRHPDRRARWEAEAALFRERWRDVILDDPYMHPLLCLWRFDEMLQ